MIEERLLHRLASGSADAEYELDLRGLDLTHSRESLVRMLERNRFQPSRTINIRLDPPVAGGGETLFQPIGRMLLEARRHQLLSALSPLPPDSGLGYRIETAGNPNGEPDAAPDPDGDAADGHDHTH